MALRIVLVAVVALGVVIAIGSGLRGLVVYGFFVGFAAVVTLAAGVGGEWVRDMSSRRFDRRQR